jgi:hypothetical protein
MKRILEINTKHKTKNVFFCQGQCLLRCGEEKSARSLSTFWVRVSPLTAWQIYAKKKIEASFKHSAQQKNLG